MYEKEVTFYDKKKVYLQTVNPPFKSHFSFKLTKNIHSKVLQNFIHRYLILRSPRILRVFSFFATLAQIYPVFSILLATRSLYLNISCKQGETCRNSRK